jgi:DNA-binding response OmpR family regulator
MKPVHLMNMATNTLLCIHKDPAELSLLKENGYELLTTNNGKEGLRLFKSRLLKSRTVDAIVIDYQLGALDGAAIAAKIRQVKPEVPIVMLVDNFELPEAVLNSVDAVVARSYGPHSLWAAVHFVISIKSSAGPKRRFSSVRSAAKSEAGRTLPPPHYETRFSPRIWKSILDGTLQF